MGSTSNTEVRKGIYHMKAGYPWGEPDLKTEKEWCEQNNRESNLDPITKELQDCLYTESKFASGKWPQRGYIETPEEFFEIWKKGELHDTGAKGFELQYTTWDRDDPYFKIGNWQGVNQFGQTKGIVIVSDLNGLVDDRRYTSLAVNDFDNQRVLSWKPKDKVDRDNQKYWNGKVLMTQEDPYITWDPDATPEFPFESKNPLKSGNYTWTTIGLSPQEIYQALEGVGYKFPEEAVAE